MKISWKIPAVAAIMMVVLNIILFVVPFNKTATFWISDAAVVIAIIVQIPISGIAFKNNSSLTSKVYGWPIMSVGLRYLAAITCCAVILILLSGNIRHFPVWISVVVYAVLFGGAAIGLIASDSTRNFVETEKIKLEDWTIFMRKLYAEANALKVTTTDREISGILSKLAESIRFSDPASCEEVFEQEGELYTTFGELKDAVKNKNTEDVKSISEKFRHQLENRNAMCKYAKRGR
ncbi:hypothetical protein [Blautia obeum]|uniref:Uncharacterized protein n=1 Tax=Blautia obeum TaxID=40520 RepID=A0A367G0G9_9FIRM|nr:hypothetical protein [Blautia obeum]RCH43703.1 hypothetical protein C4886_09850 [Blautia obeum]